MMITTFWNTLHNFNYVVELNHRLAVNYKEMKYKCTVEIHSIELFTYPVSVSISEPNLEFR